MNISRKIPDISRMIVVYQKFNAECGDYSFMRQINRAKFSQYLLAERKRSDEKVLRYNS